MQKFKRATILNEDGSIRAVNAEFMGFLKQGVSTEFTHATFEWYRNSDDAWADDRTLIKRFIVPLSQVFFEDGPEY